MTIVHFNSYGKYTALIKYKGEKYTYFILGSSSKLKIPENKGEKKKENQKGKKYIKDSLFEDEKA